MGVNPNLIYIIILKKFLTIGTENSYIIVSSYLKYAKIVDTRNCFDENEVCGKALEHWVVGVKSTGANLIHKSSLKLYWKVAQSAEQRAVNS